MRRDRIHPHRAGASSGLAVVLLVLVVAVGLSKPAPGASAKPSEIKQEYRRVLATLATGDMDSALEQLLVFEKEVVGDEQPWLRMESFWRIKLRALRDLLKSDTLDLLKPVVSLHSEAYYAYSAAGRRFMAGHSRLMASELAEIYAFRSNSQEARIFSGWVLTNFGVVLWTPTNIVQSSDLFLRATAADPRNTLALLGLGTAYEHSGNYERAIRYFDAVLRLEPSNDLARLRLSLCRLRAGEDYQQDAITALEELAASGAADWIRAIAYQELARRKMRSGDLEAAEALLQTALQTIEQDQQLRVQLAMVLDLKRRPQATLDVLGGIPKTGWDRESARQRYSSWDPPGVEERRELLRQEMVSGLDALNRALARFEDEESNGS